MYIISQKVFTKSIFKDQFPHKYVNLSFTNNNINIKNELTNLCGNGLLQIDFIDTFFEIR